MYRTVSLFPSNNPVVIAWFGVNVLDTLITSIALSMGATEISLSYQLTQSMVAVVGLKYLAVMLIVDILVQIQRLSWLNWFVGGMLFVLAWNATQIVCNVN